MQRPPFLLPVAGLVVAALLWRWVSHAVPIVPAADAAQRLGLACAWLLPSVFLLLAMIMVQMNGRAITGALDPTAGRDNRFLLLNQRVTTNTVEQLAAFVPGFFALAAGVHPDRVAHVVALAVVFAVARLAFWIGYLINPLYRAPGMAATFLTSVVTAIQAAWVWLA